MSDYTPVYTAGAEPFTMTTSAAVVGGNVLVWTGASTVGPSAGVSAIVAGVAAFDAASGARVSIWPIGDDIIHELTSSGAITAGGGVESAASGAVAAAATSIAASSAAGSLIGIAVTTAAGNKVRIQGRR